jgi:hypothetical protein
MLGANSSVASNDLGGKTSRESAVKANGSGLDPFGSIVIEFSDPDFAGTNS